ncbi:MAG: ATP-binding domain-containing protein, partial [Chloroflexi bacterium]|nr:ATP-binding domain-containing protein [Chloroflexota bacterium]
AVPGTVGDAFADLAAAMDAARQPDLVTEPGTQVAAVRAWLDPVVDRRYPRPTARIADLDRLALAAAAAPSLSRFLVELTLDPPAATGDLAGPPHLDDDVLTLTTIHSAKGGEWDVVHVIHLADGNVPSDMATGDDDAIEEERRLLYVAMTRARDVLYCYAPLRYHHTRTTGDRHGYAQLTRFLTPAVLALLDRATSRPVRRPDPDDDRHDDRAAVHPQLAAVDDRVAALWQ